MLKFHSNISRRDFMKGLSLAGAGLGAAAAAAPVFHDLDDLAVSNKTHSQHSWWIKERDYEDLTTPVDWSVFQPYDRTAHPMPPFNTPELLAARKELYANDIRTNTSPSAKHKDYALSFGARGCNPSVPWNGPELTRSQVGGMFPTQFDITPWQGTPEDNLHMVRAAFHYYGTPHRRCHRA